MTFWALAGLMIGIALAMILYPLLRGAKTVNAERQDYDLSVYKDQLAEVERDLDRGVLSENDAGAARTEIERRILKAAESGTNARAAPSPGRSGGLAALVVCLALPAAAFLMYDFLGSSGLPGQPLANREDRPAGDVQEKVIAQLQERVASAPDDLEGWLLLGNLYARLGRWGEASVTYGDALKLDGQHPEALIGRAESVVALAQGLVVPEARQLFARVLQQDPRQPSALYYAGLALAQDGHLENAHEIWSSLLAAAPADAPWVPLVQQQLARLAAELENQAAATDGGTRSGPSQEEVEAAGEMSPEEREAFIKSMVQRLADRLAETPDDLDGWLRLARAYKVLGEDAKAQDAISAAEALVEDLPPDAPERATVAAARRELGPGN